MAIRLSTSARNAGIAAITALVDAGATAGTVQVRSAPQPASPNDAPTGTLLVTITLNDPAFGAPVAGVATLDVAPATMGTAVATGTAAWFRMSDSNSNAVTDGTVTVTGGGGDMTVTTTTITSGATVTITSGTLTQPAS